MKTRKLLFGAMFLGSIGVMTACQSGGIRAVGVAPQERLEAFEIIKKLDGEWKLVKMNGEAVPQESTATFKVSSMGSSVREIMASGMVHEMTNMYHMHGGDLMVTHYCGAGNQPRMKATVVSPTHIEFKTESVTNLAKMDTEYMGELTLDMADMNSLKQTWRSIKDGEGTSHMVFEYRRK